MKKLSHIFFAGILVLATIITAIPKDVFAGANDFYFKDYVADFYLKKRSDNTSEMDVVETVTAVFPNYDQNHGIERYIPFLNQNDTNLTTESAEHLNISVTRNGNYEPSNVIAYDDHFLVRIGSADTYVHGEQTYVLKYKFVNTITDFEDSIYSTEPYQELYWNANGTETSQTFESVTVNLHMDSSIKSAVLKDREVSKTASYKQKSLINSTNKTNDHLAAWCYVGRRGSSNQDRCEITDIDDGIRFATKKLDSNENLTFVINLKDKTFTVPENNYISRLTFDRVEGDYYLSKNEDGTATLKAKERVVALFPTKNTTYSLYRNIPFVNSSGVVFTTDSQETLDIKVTMDNKEPNSVRVYSSSYVDDGHFTVSVNDDERYLHGKHEFTFEYELKNLVLEINTKDLENYEGEDKVFQQFDFTPFNRLSNDVNSFIYKVHLSNDLKNQIQSVYTSDYDEELEAFCSNGYTTKKICSVENMSDGIKFYANDVSYHSRDITMKINFKDGTFNIPEPNRNYLCYHIFIIVVIFAALSLYGIYRNTYKKISDKLKFLKSHPIVPQYTPHKDFTVGVLAKNYLSYTKNEKVATLLELIVSKKVDLKKEKRKFGRKYNWFIIIKDTNDLSDEQDDLLKIINNGKPYKVNEEIEIRHHSYSGRLETAFSNYGKHVDATLEEKGCVEKKEKKIKTTFELKSIINIFLVTIGKIILSFFGLVILFAIVRAIGTHYIEQTNFTTYSIYEGKQLVPVAIIIMVFVFLFWPIASSVADKYKKHSIYGLEVSRYMDGLKLYIKMAEADRLKFLQSVDNVDTSNEGIVKLHEKLLPYAALFGLEKSWMKELEKYYVDVKAPDWHTVGLNYSTFSMINYAMSSATSRPFDTSSSGGGFSSSSGSSGGGGGGFSGGGGGGGGFGGW